MSRTRVKICGVRDRHAAMCAAECGADAVGFVFARTSVRYIEPEAAWDIASYLPPFVTKVGLFVDAKADRFFEVKEACPFDYGQLHGSESVPLARECGPWIIKAIRFDPERILEDFRRWNGVAELDAVLVDGSAGGEGKTLDWAALAEVAEHCTHPLILAGGLTPENVGEAIETVRPYAVDVSSGVEIEKGVKDPRKIGAFCEAVREADARLAGGARA